jgi:outer membrane protein OmpA-like peptidoglycan-associated protein
VVELSAAQADLATAGAIAEQLLAERSIDLNILFDFGTAVIRDEGQAQLDELWRRLLSEVLGAVRIGLYGHTDSVGTEESNQRLSEMRVMAVRAYLGGSFEIPAERLRPGVSEKAACAFPPTRRMPGIGDSKLPCSTDSQLTV